MTERSPATSRSIFLVAIFLTFIGTCGAMRATQELIDTPVAVSPDMDDVARANATRDAMALLMDDPHRRAISAAHLIAAIMLLVGALLLFTRRESARWWVKNAIAANIAVIVASMISTFVHFRSVSPQVHAIFAALPVDPDAPSLDPMVHFSLLAWSEAISIAILVYVAWRLSRASAPPPDARGR